MQRLLTAKSTIEEVLQSHPLAIEVLASVHLPNCQDCSVRFDESLQEASDNYAFELVSILQRLNVGILKWSLSVPSPPSSMYAQHRQMVNGLITKGVE